MVTGVPVSAAATVMPHWHVTVCAAATVTTVAITADRRISISPVIRAVETGVNVSTGESTALTRVHVYPTSTEIATWHVTVCATCPDMPHWHVTVCAAATVTTVAVTGITIRSASRRRRSCKCEAYAEDRHRRILCRVQHHRISCGNLSALVALFVKRPSEMKGCVAWLSMGEADCLSSK